MGQEIEEISRKATVLVVVSDCFGKSIPDARVTLQQGQMEFRFVATAGTAKVHGIPFGLYDLKVEEPGFEPWHEPLRVYQSSMAIRAGIEVSAGHLYRRPEVMGSINGNLAAWPNLWVRLMPIYSGQLVEANVDRTGNFELDQMAVGRYLVILFSNDEVLATKALTVRGGKQSIDLAIQSK